MKDIKNMVEEVAEIYFKRGNKPKNIYAKPEN
jgi:hypothetical protein